MSFAPALGSFPQHVLAETLPALAVALALACLGIVAAARSR